MNNAFVVWYTDEQGKPTFAQSNESFHWGIEPHWLAKSLAEERILEADDTGKFCYVAGKVSYNIAAIIRN